MFTYRLICCLILVSGPVVYAQQPGSVPASSPKIFSVTEVPPEFPGGIDKLFRYMRKNLHYPESDRRKKWKGKIFVNFIVSDKGEIEDVKVLNPVSPELDAEAIKLIQSMPPWIPARQSGIAVACRYNLPVRFQ